ncbi:hypothetical protein [Deinococcus altitudinis]|uniref:hypothetical protein n=1 Tax=Deinococcus altitudinis TaxID=468914 RepID=UPI0038924923
MSRPQAETRQKSTVPDGAAPNDPRRIVTFHEWYDFWQIGASLASSWLYGGQLAGVYKSPNVRNGTWLIRLNLRPPAPVRREPSERERLTGSKV